MQLMNAVKLKLGSETETIAGFLLWQVSKLWQQRLTLALEDLGLPPTQAVILANVLRLSEEGGEVTQSSLSKATKVDRMTTSQTLRSLETKRLITRRSSKIDSRTNQIRLTDQGRETAFEAVARLAAAHQTFFRSLKDDKGKMVSYLQRLVRANDSTEF
ncbi:MAG: MarR family transcriptional regulator [Bradyrhizobium sp.]|nr:MAG: MarR family transcriptional regulator [Bradyrhizobium sp.]